jgi:hypothetical protein
MATKLHPDALELAALLRPAWADIDAGLRASGVLLNEGDPEPEPEPEPTPDPEPEPEPEPVDWKAQSRKHEREAKKARTEREALAAKLKEREDADKTEQERAVENAREEAAAAAKTETSQAFRDKLLKAEVRAQAAGKFANPALAVKLLDLDHETIFDDDGEIDTDVIAQAIDAFLEQEPGLKAGAQSRGSSDAGRGSSGTALADMTPEDHFQRIRAKK